MGLKTIWDFGRGVIKSATKKAAKEGAENGQYSLFPDMPLPKAPSAGPGLVQSTRNALWNNRSTPQKLGVIGAGFTAPWTLPIVAGIGSTLGQGYVHKINDLASWLPGQTTAEWGKSQNANVPQTQEQWNLLTPVQQQQATQQAYLDELAKAYNGQDTTNYYYTKLLADQVKTPKTYGAGNVSGGFTAAQIAAQNEAGSGTGTGMGQVSPVGSETSAVLDSYATSSAQAKAQANNAAAQANAMGIKMSNDEKKQLFLTYLSQNLKNQNDLAKTSAAQRAQNIVDNAALASKGYLTPTNEQIKTWSNEYYANQQNAINMGFPTLQSYLQNKYNYLQNNGG